MADILKVKKTDEFNNFLSENENVIVKFSAEWCGPCRTMTNVINNLNDDALNGVSFVEVDVDGLHVRRRDKAEVVDAVCAVVGACCNIAGKCTGRYVDVLAVVGACAVVEGLAHGLDVHAAIAVAEFDQHAFHVFPFQVLRLVAYAAINDGTCAERDRAVLCRHPAAGHLRLEQVRRPDVA